ncbi:MAG: divalent cation tolerance protein CutA [Nitrospinaceae bacterium]|nr:divalent-cation tolerance protein CutA [Nitrospinaceae bacterium]NIR54123.1 divalent-cation tolerance protein CutA [Nitrospinaceae bacterium]NIS87894.1 divalent-cation tolerance protein CutA [Nitrospinaceae bacterium]NIT84763.1 divalent-cation tolerance protein CutA [Nitrospinaceae bacterium]NIU46937.1 divalent-cation tolerance protein CutA [Nitrospinaceae bacterium]
MSEHIVVLITASSREESERLSRGLVEAKLAFCVNSLPGVKSTYFWDNELCVDEEILLIVKTRADRFDELEQWVVEHHSYDVPEVIALPIVQGLKPYLKGIDDWTG